MSALWKDTATTLVLSCFYEEDGDDDDIFHGNAILFEHIFVMYHGNTIWCSLIWLVYHVNKMTNKYSNHSVPLHLSNFHGIIASMNHGIKVQSE